MSSKVPPKVSRPPEVAPPGFSFDDEATVAMRGTVFSEDPTEPLVEEQEGVYDQWSSPTANPPPPLAGLSPGEARSVIAEVDRLKLLAGSRGARITPEITRALAVGVTQSGGGLLTAPQAIAAAEGLMAMADDHYQRALALFRQAGMEEGGVPIPGADVDAERALLLRAVAERRSHLETGAFAQLLRMIGIRVTSDRKISEIIAFAGEIRGRAGIRGSSGQP